MMYVILNRYIEINAELEYKSNDNYIDMIIFKNKYTKYNIMIELKYIKVKESNTYEEVLDNAIKQINNYTLDNIDNNYLRKYVIIFIGSEYKLIPINK